MYNKSGMPIYVGKAQNLQQRVSGYFTSQKTVPEKLQSLWDQLATLEVRRVGSELEALLLEHTLIQETAPSVNVQRRIAEGQSRYGTPRGCVLVLCPSAKSGHQELFWLGLAGSTYQLRVNPSRPPERQLRLLKAASTTNRPPRKTSVNLKDWGPAGNEIANRYFGRCRHQLTWIETDALSESDVVEQLKPIMLQMLAAGCGPAEIRMREWLA